MYGRCHHGENETKQNWKQGRCGQSHASREGGCGHRRGCEQDTAQSPAERKAWLEERKAHLQARLEEINQELTRVAAE
jgi:hypothetical protein